MLVIPILIRILKRTFHLTFKGPCILIFSYSKSQQDALYLNFILVRNSTYFSRLTVHRQLSEYCIHSKWYLSY